MCDKNQETTMNFLSKNVYEIIVNLKSVPPVENTEVVTDDLFLNWKEIDSTLSNISEIEQMISNSHDWFLTKIKILWSIINNIDNKFKAALLEVKLSILPFTSWLHNCSEFERFVRKYPSINKNEVILYLLKVTSSLERSLGDIYAISGNSVPFLLKDLLASEYLEQLLGKIQVRFLQLLIGCVQGMNLRNIAWHGFFCPGDVDKEIIVLFLITIATLGKQILAMVYNRRPLTSTNYMDIYSEQLNQFYSVDEIRKNAFMKNVKACKYISINHWSSWEFAFNLYEVQRFGDSLLYAMPLLENLLRSLYCMANNCQERMLTAESSVYYITLDDILAQKNSDDSENNIEAIINTNIFQMLLDLFVYQEGPRLRDKISHCEIETNEIPEAITVHTFGIILSLIIFVTNENIQDENLKEIASLPVKYRPLFHPSSLLVASLVNVLEGLRNWSTLQIPEEFHFDSTAHLDIIKKKNMYYENNINDMINNTKEKLESLSLLTMFRPRVELELISCLRKITSNIESINSNILINFKVKYEQWTRREMKSRVRDNYKRMINCLSVLQFGLVHLIISMLQTLVHINSLEEDKIKNIQRTFKQWQKYVENVVSMSNINKNRWNEIKEATIIIINSM